MRAISDALETRRPPALPFDFQIMRLFARAVIFSSTRCGAWPEAIYEINRSASLGQIAGVFLYLGGGDE
ncbi:MAG: hypothetical protein HY940_07960 [Gammaproteobacteria bacterium]|nr:hypothetical protein [Gammaproteobacteria bacterium]